MSYLNFTKNTSATNKAFTLIELLVVIAIIALLLAILMPALNKVKQKASGVVCMTNAKNLSLGWFMYQEDNSGRIVGSTADARDANGKYVGWAGAPRDESGNLLSITQSSPAVTDEDEIRGIEKGLLYDYIKSPKTYHCPGDNIRKSKYDGTKVFVTYAIAGSLNRDAGQGSEFQIKRFSEIRQPATKYNFVETAENRNWNMGMRWVMAAPEFTNDARWGWWGPMAINHGGNSVLGFCDGHSENRKWRNSFTIEHMGKLMTTEEDWYGKVYPPDDQQDDIRYMADGWAFRHAL